MSCRETATWCLGYHFTRAEVSGFCFNSFQLVMGMEPSTSLWRREISGHLLASKHTHFDRDLLHEKLNTTVADLRLMSCIDCYSSFLDTRDPNGKGQCISVMLAAVTNSSLDFSDVIQHCGFFFKLFFELYLLCVCSFILSFFFPFDSGSHCIVPAALELALQPRVAWNS